MSVFTKIKDIRDVITNKPKAQHDYVGAPSFAHRNPYSLLDQCLSDGFASNYPSIRAIKDEFKTIMPYSIDGNGKPVPSAAINALYHPNKKDSSVAFFEKLAVSSLVHRNTYLLVWRNEGGEARPGGKITPQNIAGYTFLEFPSITRRDGRTYYSIGTSEFTDNEVITIPSGVDPHNLYGGYSPNEASIKWATLDDYMADFQKGFFENGGVPAGVMNVIAATTQEFNDAVDKLEASHKGAGKNNNISYAHQPIDPNTGKTSQTQLSWTPFTQANKDIDFKNLFDQVNRRLDLAYGVSQIIKGVDDAATYANAEVSEAGFAKRVVSPLALSIYTQITHELNRITGGLGIAITYKYEIPVISDQEKVKAETKNLESQVILTMTADGYSLDSIVDAFQLSQSYKLLKKDNSQAVIDNDKPDVDEGGEVNTSPDPDVIDGVNPTNKAGGSEHLNPKAKLTDEDKLEAAARKYMKDQVYRAASEYSETASDEVAPDPTKDERDAFVDAMMVAIAAILVENGDAQFEAGKSLVLAAGFDTTVLETFTLSDTARDSYTSYMTRVADTYGADTAKSIRAVLARSVDAGLSRAETEKAIKNILNTDQYRITRLVDTELNRSQDLGSIESMKQIKSQTGANVEKSLHHPGGAQCQWCKSLEGQWVAVDQPLIGLGESVIGTEGGILVNDFAVNEGYDVHPNGGGVPIYRVVS